MIRTGQPLLIRSDLEQARDRLGVTDVRGAASQVLLRRADYAWRAASPE